MDKTSKRWLFRRSTQRVLTELSDTGKDVQRAYQDTNKNLFGKHAFALFLTLFFGVLPLAVFFSHEPNPWVSLATSCQGSQNYFSGAGQGSNGDPALGVFLIDALVGEMPFSTAKFVDIVWDLCIGRGSQAIAWFASYAVFTKSLLRTIELSPTPFRTFAGVTIDGTSIMTVYTLIADITRHRGKRVTALFTYMIISCLWILSLPTILSAMTGYVSSNQSYLRLANQQLMDFGDLTQGYILADGERVGRTNGSCTTDVQAFTELKSLNYSRSNFCPCQLPNGTVLESRFWILKNAIERDLFSECGNFENVTSNATFPRSGLLIDNASQNISCMTTLNLTLDGKQHDLGRQPLITEDAFCFRQDDTGMLSSDVYANTICLPSNDESKYQWGFSRMLTAIFVMIQFVWTITMYLLWLDAMIYSGLVKQGMTLSQLRGAFAITAAAEDRLCMSADEMIGMSSENMKELSQKDSVVDVKHLEKGKEACISRRTSHRTEEEQ